MYFVAAAAVVLIRGDDIKFRFGNGKKKAEVTQKTIKKPQNAK